MNIIKLDLVNYLVAELVLFNTELEFDLYLRLQDDYLKMDLMNNVK